MGRARPEIFIHTVSAKERRLIISFAKPVSAFCSHVNMSYVSLVISEVLSFVYL